ncbi:MAG: sigma-70 family RNA polymerase sigma factor [Myxococcota bacterium]
MTTSHTPPQPTFNDEATEPSTHPRHAEDWRLVQACIRGDRQRWAELLRLHERTLFFAVLNTLRTWGVHAPKERVEDLQGDIVIELVKNDFAKLRTYSGRSRLAQWLKVVASNYTVDQLRKKRPTVSLNDDTSASSRALRDTLPDRTEPADRRIHRAQQLHALRALYQELPSEDRRFVELFCHQELSFEQIAVAMDTTIGAVYARKNRVRKKLIALAHERGLLVG